MSQIRAVLSREPVAIRDPLKFQTQLDNSALWPRNWCPRLQGELRIVIFQNSDLNPPLAPHIPNSCWMIEWAGEQHLTIAIKAGGNHFGSVMGQLLKLMGRFHVVDPGWSVQGSSGNGFPIHRMKLSGHQFCGVSIEGAQRLATGGGPNFCGAIKGSGHYLVAENNWKSCQVISRSIAV